MLASLRTDTVLRSRHGPRHFFTEQAHLCCNPQAPDPQAKGEQGLSAMLQRDAFLAFRALCKLSTRTSESATGAADPAALRGKVCCPARVDELLRVLAVWVPLLTSAPS